MPTSAYRTGGAEGRVIQIELGRITVAKYQPRTEFDARGIDELAQSIQKYGLLSPLLVRRRGMGQYELIAGERRLRALRQLHAQTADAIVIGAYEGDCAVISLIENIQRENLHFLDEAAAIQRILTEYGMTQEILSRALGRSTPALNNLLRLLKLDGETLDIVRRGNLTQRHARALLGVEDVKARSALAKSAAEGHLTVQALERQIAQQKKREKGKSRQVRCDSRLIVNAIADTVRSLRRIGIQASSRVESHEAYFDVIVRVQTVEDDLLQNLTILSSGRKTADS